jgi:hypothetical protein
MLVSIVGCGSTDVDPATAESLKGLAGLYVQYSMTHQNVGPPNEETLKKYARSLDTLTLAGAGVERARLDEYFVSPRDKQPLKVLYGTGVTNLGRSAPMVAHEQTGVRGKKLVVYANNRIEELDEAGLKQAIEGKAPEGKAPPG